MLTLILVAGVGMAGSPMAHAAPERDTGWELPYSGVPRFEEFAPTQVIIPRQLNAPLGQARADGLAAALGFDKEKALSHRQFLLFISGQGVGGGNADGRTAAYLTDSCSRYLTNTTATFLTREVDGVPRRILLGSYGLVVNPDGMLESPANATSPCRQINWVLAPDLVCHFPEIKIPDGLPCGYMGRWMRANGARDTLAALYASAYRGEAVFGARSQDSSGAHQLVINTKRTGRTSTVGMSMIPPIWIVNFILIYALSPRLAAKMPAYWAPIPPPVADAIMLSPSGQVPYSEYLDQFPR